MPTLTERLRTFGKRETQPSRPAARRAPIEVVYRRRDGTPVPVDPLTANFALVDTLTTLKNGSPIFDAMNALPSTEVATTVELTWVEQAKLKGKDFLGRTRAATTTELTRTERATAGGILWGEDQPLSISMTTAKR